MKKKLNESFDINYSIFTDGSKIQERVGAGFVIYFNDSKNPIVELYFKLPDYATVYQAELLAIQKALLYLQGNHDLFEGNGNFSFYVDNKAAILTSGSPHKNSSPIAFKNYFLFQKKFTLFCFIEPYSCSLWLCWE